MSDSDQTVAAPEEDIRGRTVTAADDEELGKIDDLLIDEDEGRVRFLLVEHGGFLGIGQKKTFIPVDAVTRITDDHVRIDRSRKQVTDAPAYDPDLVEEQDYYDTVYSHYGYTPFWGMGYTYPPYPFPGATGR
ncbi:PRC-barrel domain-containing protein [Streptomyces fradiae]|uniref:PRC-barrel domain-containing protein n=1 Tax=Streptomyces fradiae TaxID=1906 RepID=UPI002943E2B1|nr:PRC-barrel domain-containing protein [Streptomyces fradiae]WOI61285.1 PRC-barrel domain-containing protein [Streptomyces fradiae]